VIAVLLAVYLFWGSTAPAMKVAIRALPPFAMVALRFTCAGGALWLWSRARGVALPARGEWRGAIVVGTLLLVCSNALFAWTLQLLPSGIGALFFALSPLWMALLGAALYRERIAPLAGVGLALGLGGMLYLVSPSGAQHLAALGVGLATFTSLTWALGSMLARRYASTDLVQTSAMQMLVAAPMCAVISLAFGERPWLAVITPASGGALLYLIVFGSIVGFSAFIWLMRNVPTTLASTYSYVNPLVSIAIGTLALHEEISWRTGVGVAIVTLGVALMMAAPRPSVITRSQAA